VIQTDIFYPEGLPAPLREGHTTQHVKPFLRTGMASGRARQRRKFTSVPSMGNYTWLMNDGQAAFFELWFKETLKDGAEWFNIQRKTPIGRVMQVCRFVDMYQGPNLFGVSMWQFTAQLEAWERPLLPDEWILLPDYIVHADIFDFAMNREWPAA
jgi:hypothetical protein